MQVIKNTQFQLSISKIMHARPKNGHGIRCQHHCRKRSLKSCSEDLTMVFCDIITPLAMPVFSQNDKLIVLTACDGTSQAWPASISCLQQ